MEVDSLEVGEPLESPGLNGGQLTIGEVEAGQEGQPGEGSALDDLQGVPAQAQNHQGRHVGV